MNHWEAWQWIETQANWFATYLLTPSDLFSKAFSTCLDEYNISKSTINSENIEMISNGIKNKISAQFHVSTSMAKNRIQNYFRNNF